jgi:isoleucyl-tRNA synthetase
LPDQRESLEEGLLAVWEREDLFAQTLAASEGRPAWVFYEGPPTANGRAGIHHVFARTIKDLFCRHRAMRGYHVTRKAGWDTHGLPVEIEVEKALGITVKAEIETLGVERFNALCRESVWKYRADWERLSTRIGYWLDYAHPYVTYTPEYIESVWWALHTLWTRGLLYRGHKVLPYCPRCETPLSSHELALGYREVEDPSVYVAFDLAEPGRRILVWTTTPWTLVSNVALAVHPELEYVELRRRDGDDARTLILALSRAAAVLGEDYGTRWEAVAHFPGAALVGLAYRRPLPWVSLTEEEEEEEEGEGERGGVHERIVGETFVTADDGSGVVHMAPAFGADDYAAAQRHGLAFVQPVDARGAFAADVPVVGGMFVKDADARIIEHLRAHGLLWKVQRITHAYPHCWRCGTPLLYYARSSWFVRTTAMRDGMLERNARVDWHPPEIGTGRFGEWLAGNIDWAISRDRYWGTPLPVWVCDRRAEHVEVIGSFADLAVRLGSALPEDFDPHKPAVDRLTWACRACDEEQRGTMRRVGEVIDTWFDSGSMPFAQWHFPFEGRDVVARQYPADFIAEGVDQTRGWFYSLLAIATALGDALPNNQGGHAAPYRAVVVNDLVLDAAGQKMSKSRGNAVDPWAVLSTHGADAVRLFLVAASQVWVPRRFDEQAIRDTAGRFLLTIKHVYDGIFATYANFGWAPSDADPPVAERPILDRWVLSRLAAVERGADEALERYDATTAIRAVMTFVDDDVSKWYVRLSRARFYDVEGADSRAAFATLAEVLTVSCRLLAPAMPFITDWMHRELTGGSVHLAPYVRTRPDPMDIELEAAMSDVRQLSTLGRAARAAAGIRTRQPLTRVACVVPRGDAGRLDELAPLLAAELNVKRVEWLSSGDGLVTRIAKPNFRSLGRKFGKHTPLAAAAVGALESDHLEAFERGEPLAITVEGETHHLDASDLAITHVATSDLVVQEAGGYVAAIDPRITPELAREGLARDLISAVQRTRKEAQFAVSDRIRLTVAGDADVDAAVAAHRGWIAGETLARELTTVGVAAGGEGERSGFDVERTLDLDGRAVRITITRELQP